MNATQEMPRLRSGHFAVYIPGLKAIDNYSQWWQGVASPLLKVIGDV
jgi:hypothetical protein